MRFVGAFVGSNDTSSPSSRPDISREARGRREEWAGLELVLEELPWEEVFMAIRGQEFVTTCGACISEFEHPTRSCSEEEVVPKNV